MGQGLDISEDTLVVWSGRRAEVRRGAARWCAPRPQVGVSCPRLCVCYAPRCTACRAPWLCPPTRLRARTPEGTFLGYPRPSCVRVQVYTVDVRGATTLSAFDIASDSIALYRTSLFACTPAGVAILNVQVREWAMTCNLTCVCLGCWKICMCVCGGEG